MRLLPVLKARWSPRAFDPRHELAPHEADVLLEAARWAPSAGNSQPWAFHVALRGFPEWRRLLPCLAPSSAAWATDASGLIVNLAHIHVEGSDLLYSEFAHYDLGQAVAHLIVQAHGSGLACRQFRAFDKDRTTSLLSVPPHWEVVSMIAVGLAASEAVRGPRSRRRGPTPRWNP